MARDPAKPKPQHAQRCQCGCGAWIAPRKPVQYATAYCRVRAMRARGPVQPCGVRHHDELACAECIGLEFDAVHAGYMHLTNPRANPRGIEVANP